MAGTVDPCIDLEREPVHSLGLFAVALHFVRVAKDAGGHRRARVIRPNGLFEDLQGFRCQPDGFGISRRVGEQSREIGLGGGGFGVHRSKHTAIDRQRAFEQPDRFGRIDELRKRVQVKRHGGAVFLFRDRFSVERRRAGDSAEFRQGSGRDGRICGFGGAFPQRLRLALRGDRCEFRYVGKRAGVVGSEQSFVNMDGLVENGACIGFLAVAREKHAEIARCLRCAGIIDAVLFTPALEPFFEDRAQGRRILLQQSESQDVKDDATIIAQTAGTGISYDAWTGGIF